MNNEKQTFIKVDKFETVMDALNVVRRKLEEAKTTLDKINNLKQEEDATIVKWTADLASVQTKIDNIEKELTNEEE